MCIRDSADSPLESADKLPMEAAARFLRALAYYNLAVTYGDVPLKTTPSAPVSYTHLDVYKRQLYIIYYYKWSEINTIWNENRVL